MRPTVQNAYLDLIGQVGIPKKTTSTKTKTTSASGYAVGIGCL